jgi:hypothetical protein
MVIYLKKNVVQHLILYLILAFCYRLGPFYSIS